MTVYTRLLLVGLLTSLATCRSSPTAPSLSDIQKAEAEWTTHNLTRYAYRYETTGGFSTLDGQAIRLVVLGDTVRSAQFVATSDSVPVAFLPTINTLFTLAITRREEGRLVAAQFDSTFGYPARLEFSGPPDASSVIVASDIELLP
jgi:hypothetical protein